MSATIVANALASQLGWFALVLGAAMGASGWGIAVAAALIAWHVGRASHRTRELVLVALVGLVGLIFEAVLLRLELTRFPADFVVLGVPLWMIALWMLFATSANVSLRWLRDRVALSALLGAISAPLAYWGGARLGALELPAHATSLAAIAAGWALLTPLVLRAAWRLDGYDDPIARREVRRGLA